MGQCFANQLWKARHQSFLLWSQRRVDDGAVKPSVIPSKQVNDMPNLRLPETT